MPHFNIRNKLLLAFLFASVVPIIFVSFLSLKFQRDAISELYFKQSKLIADSYLQKINGLVSGILKKLDDLQSDANIITNFNNLVKFEKIKSSSEYKEARENLNTIFQNLQRSQDLTDIFLVGLDGTVYYASNVSHSWYYIDKKSDEMGFPPINDEKEIAVSDIFKDKIKGNILNILMSTQLKDADNHVYGHLIFEIPMDTIYKSINVVTIPTKSTEILLGQVTSTGILAASPLAGDYKEILNKMVIKNTGVDFYNTYLSSQYGYAQGLDYKDRDVLFLWEKDPVFNLTLIVKTDKNDVFSSINQVRNYTVLSSIVIALFFSLIAAYLATTITNPILKLTAQVQKQSEEKLIGSLDNSLLEKRDEIGVLANVFLEKSKQIEKYLQELKNAQIQLVQSEKMSSLGILTAGIAHEINNPVNFIQTSISPLKKNLNEIVDVINRYSEVAKSPQPTKSLDLVKEYIRKIDLDFTILETQNLLEAIQSGAKRTAIIVKNLRNVTRLDENVVKKINLKDNINSILLFLINSYKHITFITHYDPLIPAVECIPGQINQAIMNILMNAIESIQEKGTITITTKGVNQSVTIEIKDTGRGISKDFLEKIFDPFFTTKPVGSGAGLGLTSALDIIQGHHGTIQVKSIPNTGSEFMITLPIEQAENMSL